MGTWKVDDESERGILRLTLEGAMSAKDMEGFVSAHNRAIDRFHGDDYRVWCDISRLLPLSAECADWFEKAKQYSSKQPNFRGSGVLVSSATVAMQHRRTSISGGVMETELISDDAAAIAAHLRTVSRP